jgi:CRISPR/Cas system-associated exonuclease Cas4 (RecB family)
MIVPEKKGAKQKKDEGAPTKGDAKEGAPRTKTSRENEAMPIVIVPKGEVKMTHVPEHPLIGQLLDKYVDDWKREHSSDKKARPYFYVSDAGRCARQLVYQFLNPEQKHDMKPSTIAMFMMGGLFHEEIQTKLMKIGATTAKDIEFGTFGGFDFEVRGRLDVMLVEDGKYVVSDIKSKNSFAFNAEPGIEEVLQLLIYIHQCKMDKYFKKKGMEIADYGYLIYADRGGVAGVPVTMWRAEYDPVLVDQVREWFEKIDKVIKEKIYPERPFVRDSVDCSYCRFKEWCWRDLPEAVIPAHIKDESIIPPTQEIVESMAAVFASGKSKISELEKEIDQAEAVLKQYFKGTGQSELLTGNVKLRYEKYLSSEVDVEYLMRFARDKWTSFARPQIAMLREAVKAGTISGTVFEKAMKSKQMDRIKIDRPKKVVDK